MRVGYQRLLTMKLPCFTALKSNECGEGVARSYAARMYPNPKFYKYRWWIFWENSPVDGDSFLLDEYSLNTFTAMTLASQLAAHN